MPQNTDSVSNMLFFYTPQMGKTNKQLTHTFSLCRSEALFKETGERGGEQSM